MSASKIGVTLRRGEERASSTHVAASTSQHSAASTTKAVGRPLSIFLCRQGVAFHDFDFHDVCQHLTMRNTILLLTKYGEVDYVEMVCQLRKALEGNIVDIKTDREMVDTYIEHFSICMVPQLCEKDAKEIIRLHYFYGDSAKSIDTKRKLEQLLAYRSMTTNELDAWGLEFLMSMQSLMAKYINFMPTKKQSEIIEKLYTRYRTY